MIQYIVFVLLAIMSLFACESDKCFYRAGDKTTEVHELDSFKTIGVYGLLDIELVQDSLYYVEIVAGKNVIKHVELKLISDTISLYNNNICSWLRDYKRPLVRIHFEDIRVINLYESSFVFSNDSVSDSFTLVSQCEMAEADVILNCDRFFFYVHHNTGGRYTFKGKANSVTCFGYYSSVIDALELEVNKMKVGNYSPVDYRVWATEELKVEIYNTGNIYYKGTPKVIIDTLNSTGYVFPIN